jgi:hypothetical protein
MAIVGPDKIAWQRLQEDKQREKERLKRNKQREVENLRREKERNKQQEVENLRREKERNKQQEKERLQQDKQREKDRIKYNRELEKKLKNQAKEREKNEKEKMKLDKLTAIECERQLLSQQVAGASQILDVFNPVEGGETTLYYLRLVFRDKYYYKVGITFNSVRDRYNNSDFKFIDKILYEKKLTHARTIEQDIISHFKDSIFPLAILSSGESEIFDEDVLRLDTIFSSTEFETFTSDSLQIEQPIDPNTFNTHTHDSKNHTNNKTQRNKDKIRKSKRKAT